MKRLVIWDKENKHEKDEDIVYVKLRKSPFRDETIQLVVVDKNGEFKSRGALLGIDLEHGFCLYCNMSKKHGFPLDETHTIKYNVEIFWLNIDKNKGEKKMKKFVIVLASIILLLVFVMTIRTVFGYGLYYDDSNLWPNNPPTPPVIYGNDPNYNRFLQDQYNKKVQRYLEEEQRRRLRFEENIRDQQRQRELDDFFNKMKED